MSTAYYKPLDGLRAVAVLVVLLAHAGSPFPQSGGVGVDIFFVISGFLITGILAREAMLTGGISFRRFYIRRALRLGPCLLLACGIVTVQTWFFHDHLPTTPLAYAMTYTANWAMALGACEMGLLGHCWSLSIEEQYYLVWPVVILLLERKRLKPNMKFLILVCAALLAALYRWYFVGTYSAERIYYGLDTHLDGLIIGSALFYFASSSKDMRLDDWPGRMLAFILVPFAAAGLLLIMKLIGWWNPWMGRVGFLLVALAAAVLIADVTINSQSLLQQPLSWPPLAWVGKVSYGLYLYHYPVFDLVDQLNASCPASIIAILKFVLTFALAAFSYHSIEVRFLSLKRHFEAQLSNPTLV